MGGDWTQPLRAIKAFLIILGVLLVAGFVFVGVEVWRRATAPAGVTAAVPGEPAAADAPRELTLGLPAGSRIDGMVAVDDRLVVRARLPDGGERLYVLAPRSGRVTAIVVP